MKSINHFVLALVAAFVLSIFAPAMAKSPAPAASGAPTTTKKAPKAEKTPAAKKAEKSQSTTGKVTKWSDNAFSIQAKNNKTMDFTYTKGKCYIGVTSPQGKTVKVWYKSDKTATKVEEVKAAKEDKKTGKTPAPKK